MYKKLILASAIAAVSSTGQAATWGGTGSGAAGADFFGVTTVTKEGISKVSAVTGVELSTAPVVLGASYAVGDQITFTYNVDKATGTNFSTGFRSWAPNAAAKTDVSSAAAASDSATLLIDDAGNNPGEDAVQVGDTFTAVDNTEGTGADQVFTVTSIAAPVGTILVSPNISIANDKPITWGSRAVRYIDFGLASSTASTATYRVTAIEAVGGAKATTVGAVVHSPLIAATPASLTSVGTATVSFAAATSAGAAIDALATAKTIGMAKFQDTVSITTKLDAVVDVEQSRKALVGGTPTASTDTLVFTNTAVAAAAGKKSSLTTAGVLATAATSAVDAGSTDVATHTINGDFAFVDNNLAVAGVTSTTALSCTGTNTVESVASAGTSVKVIDTGIETITCTFTKDQAAAVVPNQAFSGTTKKTWTSASIADTSTTTWASLGAWTLNGASITAYGVPMGSAVSRFMWLNNKGATDAVTSYTATMNGSSYGPYEIATVPAKTATSLGGLIDADLSARGIFVAESGRANIVISTPVADADVTLSASYKHNADADRVALETSDTTSGATNAAK